MAPKSALISPVGDGPAAGMSATWGYCNRNAVSGPDSLIGREYAGATNAEAVIRSSKARQKALRSM
jgi:hypothetical protein